MSEPTDPLESVSPRATATPARAPWGRPPEVHILVCTNERPPGTPRGSCGERGSVAVFDALKQEAARQGVAGRVLVNRTNCLKPCAFGPTVVVHPRGDWYGGVGPQDAPAVLACALEGRAFTDRLLPEEAHASF